MIFEEELHSWLNHIVLQFVYAESYTQSLGPQVAAPDLRAVPAGRK